MKKVFRILIRKLLKARSGETIHNAIKRRKTNIKKVFYTKPVTLSDFQKALIELGIQKGDNVMLHASWRDLYNLKGSPDDLINVLKEILGPHGTLVMPSYGKDRNFFDVEKSPSAAGVISEVFRNQKDTFRSACTHFSVAAWGYNAKSLTENHINSEYGFDQHSPYYLFSQLNSSKVLFLGLGKEPTQISLFHCAGYLLKEKMTIYKKLLSHSYETTLIVNGIKYKKEMIIRKPGHRNNNKVFRRILREIKKKNHSKLSNIDLVVLDANEGLNKAIEFGYNGQYCYENMNNLN